MRLAPALALAAALMVSACAGRAVGPAPDGVAVDIRGIMILNNLTYPVRDVLVEVPATGRFAGCGNILPRTRCQATFPAQHYDGHDILVSWTEQGEPHATEPFTVEPPDGAAPRAVFWLQVEVFAPGQAGARLVQP